MERLSLAQICSWRMMNSKITVVLRLFYFLLEIETANEGTKDRLVRWWIVYQYVWIRKSSRFSDTNFHIENKQLGLIKFIFISMTRVLKKGFLEGSWRSSRNIYKSLVFHYFCLIIDFSLHRFHPFHRSRRTLHEKRTRLADFFLWMTRRDKRRSFSIAFSLLA